MTDSDRTKPGLDENKRSKALFMVVACLVLHLAFRLEHNKINISEPRNILRTRLRLETFEDYASILTRWLAN